MSSYIQMLTLMISEAKNQKDAQHLYDIHDLIQQMIAELVPPLVKQCFEEISIDVQTRLNGKPNDLTGLKKDITKMLIEKLNSGK